MKKREILSLFLILAVAVFFRFNQLNRVPPGSSLDEVSIGWNAYSILQTGADEYGTRFPVLLRAYDDWRPALYVYLVMPFVKIFGLTAMAVRLPSVLLSLLTILVTYFLVKELFPAISPRRSASAHHPRCLAPPLIAGFLLAVSPWHIYLSRLGHEVNLGLTLSVLAIFFFVKFANSVSRQTLFLLLSAFFWALSFYTYQSQKIFAPAMIIGLVLIYRKKCLDYKKGVVLAGLLGILLLIPVFRASLAPEALVRFRGTSIFSAQSEAERRSSLRIARDYQTGDALGLVLDNRRIAGGLMVLRAYFSHFDPGWLFFNTGEEKHKIPGLGILYLWELPLILIGIYKLAGRGFPKQSKRLLLVWILAAPLAASLTTETPHAMRTFGLLPAPQILAAIGAGGLMMRSKRLFQLLLILVAAGLVFLYHNYFINFPFEQSKSFQYPLSRAIAYSLKEADKYEKIVFSNQDSLYQSYMFFLFYSRYDPGLYQLQGGTVSGGFAETHQFGKYEFRPIDWANETEDKKTLYFGNAEDFPRDLFFSAEFRTLNDEPAILVVDWLK